jgi:hypothetical protein
VGGDTSSGGAFANDCDDCKEDDDNDDEEDRGGNDNDAI